MASVGDILRRERERQGLSLARIANETRIKLQYLEALERDDFDGLPGKFFARSFTNQYADKLGANTAELQAALQNQVAPAPIFTATEFPATPNSKLVAWSDDKFSVEPLPEGTASAMNARKLTASLVGLVAVIIACGTIFWLWQRSQISTTSAGTVTETPAPTPVKPEVQQPVTQSAIPPAQPSATQSNTPVTTTPPATTPAVQNPPVVATQQVSSQVSAAPVSGKINLEVVAKENVWIRITVDGQIKVQRALQPGESSVAFADESARILLGNAGGADIRFNGSSIGPVGPRGQVRVVDFTPQKFTVVEPQKKPEPGPSQPVD